MRKASLAVALGMIAALTLPSAGICQSVDQETGAQQTIDPVEALNKGNQLYRDGQVEAAIDIYRQGHSSKAPHPTLLYNLGSAMHHLDRLPEAILWYRRGESEDPWLQDNLWLARRSLGSQSLPPGGILGQLTHVTGPLKWAAIGVSWITLLLLILWPRMSLWSTAGTALLAFSLYFSALAVERWGPQPAVLLKDCLTNSGDLPAGTEAWVRRASNGYWLISGAGQLVCPGEAIELVHPQDSF